jgi:tetratricopeptide (TPR) repeat protein
MNQENKINKINKTTENKTTEIEESFRKILFYYWFRVGIGITIFLVLFVIGSVVLWQYFHETKYIPPTHQQLDPHSTTYWVDRTLADINLFQNTKTKTKNSKQLYLTLMNTLNDAQKISSNYLRIIAISDIALTMAKNDVDINIDNIIQSLGDTPLAASMRTRIIASQSLMFLRLAKRSAARVAIQEYDRIVIEADLKLNTPTNEFAFLGVITALACLEDTPKLTDIFNKQIEFSLRTTTEQRMRAYRFIAGEQARVGMSVYAMNTAQKIKNSVERVRAYQLIIAHTARPAKITPVEPTLFLPPIEGPWKPLPEPVVAQHIINDVIKQIADCEELEEQIDLLTMLSESRLMCDSEIHRLFREGVVNQESIDELVKRPILQHLDEPRSERIRASLKLPPLPKNLQQNVDSALDDWNSPTGMIPVSLSEIEPTVIKGIIDQQKINVWLMMSQCYQLSSRHTNAVQVLRKAAAIASKQKQSKERIQTLLKIGEHLLSVGSITDAHTVLKNVGLPSIPPATISLPAETSSSAETSQEDQTPPAILFTPEQLSYLARLQIVGRFFDDALQTIRCIEPPSAQVHDFAFLAVEQIRIGHFGEAAKTISAINDTDQVEKLQHLLAIAQGGNEKHYTAIKIPFPENLQHDEELRRCCELLIQNGLFSAAVTTAEKIKDTELQSQNLTRLVREYMLLFKAYGEDSDWHRSVRESLLKTAHSVAEKIVHPTSRTEALETILTTILPYTHKENRKDFLLRLFDEAFKTSRQINTPEDKVELMSRLILNKIALETNQLQPNRLPLFNRDTNPIATEAVEQLITEAVDVANEVGDVPKRGYALAALAKALGQIGRFQGARTFVKNAEETAKELTNKREAISILLSLIPTLQSLGDSDSTRKVYDQAFTIISDSFFSLPAVSETTIYEWQLRNSELDRVIRSLLEHNFIIEAVTFSNRINEPQLRDRLLRAAAYIYMDQGNFTLAETTIRKLELPRFRTNALREVLFMKRHANDQINHHHENENNDHENKNNDRDNNNNNNNDLDQNTNKLQSKSVIKEE